MYHSGNQLIDPHFLFEKAGLAPGMHLADFGSGRTGNFVFPAAKIVGDKGAVYAIDIMKESLAGLAKRAALGALHHVHTVWANIEKPETIGIPPQSIDVVLLINFLSAIEHDALALASADRLVKSGGRILIVDWTETSLPFAPPKEDLVQWSDTLRWAEAHGYGAEEEFSVGKYHRGLLLAKA